MKQRNFLKATGTAVAGITAKILRLSTKKYYEKAHIDFYNFLFLSAGFQSVG
jgi:hypothetical protein